MGRYSKEQKEEVLTKIRGGRRAADVATEHGINPKTVSYWVTKSAEKTGENATELGRLRRENESLRSIIGRLVYEQELGKKNRASP